MHVIIKIDQGKPFHYHSKRIPDIALSAYAGKSVVYHQQPGCVAQLAVGKAAT